MAHIGFGISELLFIGRYICVVVVVGVVKMSWLISRFPLVHVQTHVG